MIYFEKMKTKSLPLLFLLLFISACGTPSVFVPTSTPKPIATEIVQPTQFESPGCIPTEPTQGDIDRALSFTGKMFDTGDWKRSYSVAESRVSITWLSDQLASVVYLESLIFACGYEEIDIENYFNNEYWPIIFENYESYEMTNDCQTSDGLRLYLFDVANLGSNYSVKYWVQPDTDHRLITVMMAFHIDNRSILDDFSYRLFPRLTSCS